MKNKNDMEKIILDLVERYPVLSRHASDIEKCADVIADTYREGKKVLICGNGGSAADSDHIAAELMKRFILPRKIDDKTENDLNNNGNGLLAERLEDGIFALSLSSNSALLTAIANDNGYDCVFAQQVYVAGKRGDVLIALSTSGNSASVVNAAVVARSRGMYIVGLTSKDGGKLLPLCDVCFAVDETETFKTQELHLPIYHAVCALAEEKIWGKR